MSSDKSAKEPQELDLFLSQLESAGTAESQGTFTLSPHAAAQAMRRFRLPESHMYLLQMVATAVSAGVTQLTIKKKPRALEFFFESLEIQEEDLRVLDTFLFPAVDAPIHLTELAVGVEAALNFAEEIHVESFTQVASRRLVVSTQATRLEHLKASPLETAFTRVVVKKWREVNLLWKSTRHPELEWLEACRHASIPISVDGQPIDTTPFPPLPKETILWANIGLGEHLESATDLFPPNRPSAFETEHGSVFGYLALLPREHANRHGLLFVHRGLVVHRPLTDTGLTVLCGILHCDFLKKDLSHTNFVEDADFRGVQEFLHETGVALVTRFCHELAEHQVHWKDLWGTVVGLLQDGHLKEEQRTIIGAWADEVDQTGESQSPFAAVHKARFLDKAGRDSEAERLRWGLLSKVRTESLLLFDRGELEEIPEKCEVLKAVLADLGSPLSRLMTMAGYLVGSLLDLPFEPEDDFDSQDPLTLHRLALIRRWRGDLAGAVELHLRALQHEEADNLVRGWGIRYCAELEFSQKRYEQADKLYDLAEEELPKQRDLWEERAYFKRFLGVEQSGDSLSYLRRALAGMEADSFVHWLLMEEIKKQGRSVLSRSQLTALQTKSTYLKLKRLLAEGEQAQIEAALEKGLDLQGFISREELIDEKVAAVEQAERAFGPTYLYTRYCRRRCAYQLHRLGAVGQAEQLQCRGHLLEHLRMILKD